MGNGIDHILGLLEEPFLRKPLPRIPETEMTVETPSELAAYNASMQNGARVFVLMCAQEAARAIKYKTNILDVGCGSGDLMFEIARANPAKQFTGADTSAIAIAEGARRAKELGITNVRFVQVAGEDLGAFKDGEFDAVYSRFTFHQLPDEQALFRLVRAMKRVLKPDGALIAGDFQRLKSKRLIRAMSRGMQGTENALVRLFRESLHAAFDCKTLDDSFSIFAPRIKRTLLFPLPYFYIVTTRQYPLGTAEAAYFTKAFSTLSLPERFIVWCIKGMLFISGYYGRRDN